MTQTELGNKLGVSIVAISGNLLDDPEIKYDVDKRNLDYLINILDYDLTFSADEKEPLISEIKESCENIKDANDRKLLFDELVIEYSHKVLNFSKKPYADYDITDIAHLIGTYLSLNENGQTKVREYAIDLFYNPYLRIKEEIEADNKYQVTAPNNSADQPEDEQDKDAPVEGTQSNHLP